MPDMLYEIGTEELPASYIQPALDQLRQSIAKELEEASLEHGDIYTTATPRRLVLAVGNLAERQPDRDEEIIGPPAKIAFDAQGNPTGAGRGFARSQGVELTALQRKKTPRGEYCTVNKRRKGRDAAELLAEILPRVALKLSFPKSMLWPGSDRPFARPVRSLTALLGDRLIGFTLFGIRTDRAVESHPILAPGALTLPNADLDAYRTLLREHCVVVDADERREIIREKIAALPPDSGVIALPDEDKNALIDEVANLVQYPSVTRGRFKKDFLDIPAPIIKAAMTEHQRYFPLGGKDGLRPYFIVVSDRGPNHADAVRSGNEAVLSARLADAQFFYRIDSASSLADRIPSLDGVQFLTGLGTYRDKCLRLEKLVLAVAETLGLDPRTTSHAARAAQLCKADLVTEMVAEFPKLQGEVGRIYALNDGEPEPVATAILEHYLPRSAGGPLPQTPAGVALSLAEKLDNLAACFALGLVPTGSADCPAPPVASRLAHHRRLPAAPRPRPPPPRRARPPAATSLGLNRSDAETPGLLQKSPLHDVSRRRRAARPHPRGARPGIHRRRRLPPAPPRPPHTRHGPVLARPRRQRRAHRQHQQKRPRRYTTRPLTLR